MAKAYWISCYREIIDPAKLAALVEAGKKLLQGRF